MAYKKTTSSNTDLPQWAKNIKLLRKSRGELQFQLGNIIGYSDRAISAFENGRNTPSEEIFTKITDHYEVTLDMLLHEKLTKKIISQRNEIIDISMQTTWFNALCVRVKSNRALNDEHFIMATDCFEKLLSINTISTIFIRESFEKCKNAYYDSYKHSRIIAGAANTLMVIILEYAFLKVPPEMYGRAVFWGNNNSSSQWKIEKFRKCASDLNVDLGEFPAFLFGDGSFIQPENVYRIARMYLKEKFDRLKEYKVFLCGGRSAFVLFDELVAAGKVPGKDFFLLTYYLKSSLLPPLDSGINFICRNLDREAEILCEQILRLVDDPTPQRCCCKWSFISAQPQLT